MTTKTTRPRGRDAHYHAVKATARWGEFVAGTAAGAKRTAAERAARHAARERETTYARGVEGSS